MEFNQPNLPPRKQPAGFTTPGATIYDHASRSTKNYGIEPASDAARMSPICEKQQPTSTKKQNKKRKARVAGRPIGLRAHARCRERVTQTRQFPRPRIEDRAAAGGLRDSHRRKRRNSIIIAGDRSSARPDRHGRRGGVSSCLTRSSRPLLHVVSQGRSSTGMGEAVSGNSSSAAKVSVVLSAHLPRDLLCLVTLEREETPTSSPDTRVLGRD